MKTLLFTGCRGGVGNSSIVANLAAALQSKGHQTLSLDLNPANTTSLYFGVKPGTCRGWATALLSDQTLADAAFQSGDGRWVLPFGNIEVPHKRQLNTALHTKPEWLFTSLSKLEGIDYLLIDCPSTPPSHWIWPEHHYLHLLLKLDAQLIVTLRPAAVDYTLLSCSADWRDYSHHLLLNMQRPESPLERDLQLVFNTEYKEQLLAVAMSYDSAVTESCAHFQSVIHFAPGSQSAKDFLALAQCCENLWHTR